jgi:hypothetical protein
MVKKRKRGSGITDGEAENGAHAGEDVAGEYIENGTYGELAQEQPFHQVKVRLWLRVCEGFVPSRVCR